MNIGWFVWTTQKIKDGRLVKSISETFALCYLLQAVVMVRAQFTNPMGHTMLHWLISAIFLVIGLLYGIIRFGFRAKDFELPGGIQDD